MDRFPYSVDPGAFRRSTELAFSEAEAAFNSLSSEVAAANVEREVRLGEPAVVLAEVAADCGAELIVVLSHPLRQRILEELSVGGEASPTAIARRLDEQGWHEVAGLMEQLLASVQRVQADSATRAAEHETAARTIDAEIALLLFNRTPLSS
jgi:hypothetical protein